MKSLAVKIAIALVFNAITLWVASVLPGVRLGSGFLWAVVVFTAATLLVKPLVAGLLRRRWDHRQQAGGQERRTWLMTKVSTLGERVEDTFLIDGPELQQNRRQIEIETELLEALAA